MSGEDIKTKVCSKCGKELPMTDEYFCKYKDRYRKDRYRAECKECENRRHRKYYETHKEERTRIRTEFFAKWKKPCQKCGEQRLYLIQFHHIDPASKEFDVSANVANKKAKICEEEVKKCVCLCPNCHNEFHYFYGMNPEDPVNAIKEYLKE